MFEGLGAGALGLTTLVTLVALVVLGGVSTESTVVLPVVLGVTETVPLLFTDTGSLALMAAVDDKELLIAVVVEESIGARYLIA
jgi:hypothetical protein